MGKTFEQGKEEIANLCQYFATNREAFCAEGIKEADVCSSLIEPFFEALGWDVRNTALVAPRYREVVPQKRPDMEGQQDSADYAFRIGPSVNFFVEAKKCAVNIGTDPAPALQLRRYGWNAGLGVSILTNFEQFAVYDCTRRPRPSDRASYARTRLCLKYTEYVDRWQELWNVFSPQAVRSGAFDKYAGSKKPPIETVDTEFLKEIEGWRDVLAHNIALRNKWISSDDLNAAVQATIDRIVFLRMAEDRGLEPSKQLLKLCGQNDIYSHFMRNVCRKADDKYNSGLFHFQKEEGVPEDPDRITPKVEVDDKVFKTILQSLYSEHGSPYDFRVMPLEILGTIYERFLGKVIRLTAGHRAQVEEKPDVRKAGGVHYTPPYIAGYTIKQTIGRQIEGRGPAQLAGGKGKPLLRILDPACGSGTFLLGAYQYLLDYYLKWYSEHQPENYKKAVYKDEQSGEWRLIIEEKKRILTTHIFGVDIDRQAVEVTKLSLLLKVLEGESEQTISQQLRLFHERALPNLVNNIKCGNSLIGSDYNKNNLIPDADSEELKRINPLDWKQGFPDAMKAGGFGCIIGNPPWGGDIDRWLLYFHEKYPATTQEHTDSFKLFIERAVCLLPFAGLVAMIVPNTILRQRRLKDIRALLLQHKILSLVDLGEDVFQGVVAPSCIFVVERNEPTPLHEVAVANLALLSNAEKATVLESGISNGTSIRQTEFQRNPDLDFAEGPRQYRVPTLLLGGCKELECKDAGINYQRVGTGMQDKGKSDLADRLLYEGERQHPGDKMYWKGADMNRFWIADSTTRFCRPNYKKFVLPNEVVRLNERVYDRVPKILFRQTADRLIAAIDYRGIWFGRSIIAILVRSGFAHEAAYFLGILNSKYLRWVYNNLAHEGGRVFAQVKLAKVKQLPIRTINFSDAADKAAHDQMVGLVDSMQTLHKQLAAIDSESGKAVIQRQIESTDAEIDQLVYNLYGLTAEEIEIVENSTAKGV